MHICMNVCVCVCVCMSVVEVQEPPTVWLAFSYQSRGFSWTGSPPHCPCTWKTQQTTSYSLTHWFQHKTIHLEKAVAKDSSVDVQWAMCLSSSSSIHLSPRGWQINRTDWGMINRKGQEKKTFLLYWISAEITDFFLLLVSSLLSITNFPLNNSSLQASPSLWKVMWENVKRGKLLYSRVKGFMTNVNYIRNVQWQILYFIEHRHYFLWTVRLQMCDPFFPAGFGAKVQLS